jgi:hypothetical protein
VGSTTFDIAELRAMQGANNLASGKSMSSSTGSTITNLTDGNATTTQSFTSIGEVWVQVDLGGYFRVDNIQAISKTGTPDNLNGAKIYSSINDLSGMTSAQLDAASNVTVTVIANVADGGTFTATQPNSGDKEVINAGANTITATATDGNSVVTTASKTITLDAVLPAVTSLSITSATDALNGWLNAGDVVTATVNLGEDVIVTGPPQLALTVGGSVVQASYDAANSTARVLKFNYTVVTGNNDANGISLATNAPTLSTTSAW